MDSKSDKGQCLSMSLNMKKSGSPIYSSMTNACTSATATASTTTTPSSKKLTLPIRKLSHAGKNRLPGKKIHCENRKNSHQPAHQQNQGRRKMRRSMSFDTIPKMKNKVTICQPISVQRRITISRMNSQVPFQYKNQHLVLICLAMISFCSMLAMSIIAPFFPKESSKKGMRESINGLVFSAYALVLMIFSPIVSLMIPRFGTKRILVSGVLIAGVANILFGFLDTIDDLKTFTVLCFVVRILEALGGTAFSTATYTIVMAEFADNVGTAFSIVETSVGLGLSLGPAIGGFLYGFGGYGLPFYVLGSLMLLTIPFCVLVIPNNRNCQLVKTPKGSYIRLLSIFKIIINGFIIVIGAQLLSFLDPTIEPHLRQIGFAPHYVSLAFLIMSATYTLTSPLIGYLSSITKNKFQIMTIGLVLLSIEFLFLGPADFLGLETSFIQTSVIMAFIGVSYSLAFIPTFETFLELSIKHGFPNDISTYSMVSGVWSSFCSFGEILGPVFGGILTENIGFSNSALIMGMCSLTMALICFCTCVLEDDEPPRLTIPREIINKTRKSSLSHRKKDSVINEKTPLLY